MIALGATLAMVERELGPCTKFAAAGTTRTCFFVHRGLDVELKDNVVTRLGLYREGRGVTDKEYADLRYRAFVGDTEGGVHVGMPLPEVEAKLGPPKRRLKPEVTKPSDGAKRLDVLDYGDKGFYLEIDLLPTGPAVGAIQLPKIDAKPW